MEKTYIKFYIIYYYCTTTNEFKPYQLVQGITTAYFNKKDAENKIKSLTKYPKNYEIVEYVKDI